MRTFIYGLIVAVVLGAGAAPVAAGLLGLVGMASSPIVRTWLFAVPETLCGMAGIENPGLGALIVAWTIEFIVPGIVIAWIAQVRAKQNAVVREVAYDQAVTSFHDEEDYEAEYE